MTLLARTLWRTCMFAFFWLLQEKLALSTERLLTARARSEAYHVLHHELHTWLKQAEQQQLRVQLLVVDAGAAATGARA